MLIALIDTRVSIVFESRWGALQGGLCASPCSGRCPESKETLGNYSYMESVGLWGLKSVCVWGGQSGKVYFI